MHLDTNFRPSDVADAMTWLMSQIGGALKKRVADLKAREYKNPLFSFYCRRQFSLEFALEEARRYRQITGHYPRSDPFDLSYGFAVTSHKVFTNLDHPAQTRFSGCLRDGMKGDYGLRPVAYEVQILTHLCRRGFDVVCMDLCGKANFDFLATRLGAELEVECKTVAPDAGFKIHLDKVASLGGRLLPISQQLFEAGGHHLIHIQVPDRLQATEAAIKDIASLVETAVSAGSAKLSEVATVEYRQPPSLINAPESDPEERARAMFRTEFGVETGIILFHGSKVDGTFVAISVHSARPNSVVATLSERAKDAAKQCSGTRPAIIAMQLDEASTQTLREAIHEPSGLYDIASAVFGDGIRGHINSIVFTIPPLLERDDLLGMAQITGPVGIISNPAPIFQSPVARELFTGPCPNVP